MLRRKNLQRADAFTIPGCVATMNSAKVPKKGHFTLLYFASASSYTAKDFEFVEAPFPLSGLFDHLEKNYEGIRTKILDSCLVTVNLEYVDVPDKEGKIIQEGDEVAIIPPVSSG